MRKSNFSIGQISSGIMVPLIVLVILAVGYFMMLPRYHGVRQQRVLLAAKQDEVKKSKEILDQLKGLVKEFDAKHEQATAITDTLPTAPEIPEILANFDYLAKQSGLTLVNLQITLPSATPNAAPPKPDAVATLTENLVEMRIDLTLAGKYPNLKNFLTNLEQNARLLDLKSLNFNESSEANGLQNFVLKIQTYYQK